METPKQAIIRYTVKLVLCLLFILLPLNFLMSRSTQPAYEELQEVTIYPIGYRTEVIRHRRGPDSVYYYIETDEKDYQVRSDFRLPVLEKFFDRNPVVYSKDEQGRTIIDGERKSKYPVSIKCTAPESKTPALYEMSLHGSTVIPYNHNHDRELRSLQIKVSLTVILIGIAFYALCVYSYLKTYKREDNVTAQKSIRNPPQRRSRRRGRGKFLRPADKGDKS